MVESLYPPHSRLFVACDRETTEEELIGEFQNYGSVVNVKLSRERPSGKPKGIHSLVLTSCQLYMSREDRHIMT